MRTVFVKDALFNKLHVYIFDHVKKSKGVIQILHGVNEHGMRYQEFAQYMNQKGYIVVVHDHKAQGNSRVLRDKDVVNFGYKGHEVLVDGMRAVKKMIDIEYPGLDVFAFGHSLGALIIRNYLYKHENTYKKIILSGSGYQNPKGIGLMIFIGKVFQLLGNKPSKFFDNVFRQTQLKLNEKTEISHFIEWLTRDKQKTEINKTDSFLYIRLTVSSFVDILRLVKRANNKKIFSTKYKEVDMLLISGTHDPSTDWGNGTRMLAELLNESGSKAQYILYEEGRHDCLQEINRMEIFEDILTYIQG